MPPTAETGAVERPAVQTTGADRPARRFPSSRVSRAERDRMLKEARGKKFAVAVRGYDRGAVDRYVEQVNRLLAELEISSSPEAAVRHALDEVSEETRELLQRAHQTAEEITARSPPSPCASSSPPSAILGARHATPSRRRPRAGYRRHRRPSGC